MDSAMGVTVTSCASVWRTGEEENYLGVFVLEMIPELDAIFFSDTGVG